MLVTRLLRLSLVFLSLSLIGLMPTAAQSAPRIVETTVLNAINDNLINAEDFYPTQRFTVTGVDAATIQIDEPLHTCLATPDTGKNSVWFEASLPNGLLSLDTAGSLYNVASSDTVISVYRQTATFISFANLQPVLCEDDGTNTAQIIAMPIIAGKYMIQISATPSTTVETGAQVVLKTAFIPQQPISNDDLANAKPMTFPNHYLHLNAQNATREENELTAPTGLIGTHSVWYKFNVKLVSYYVIQNIAALSTGTKFDLFQAETVNGVTDYTYLSSAVGMWAGLLDTGKYVLRVSATTVAAGTAIHQYNFVTAAYLGAANFEFSTGFFYDDGTLDMTGWTTQKANTDSNPDEAMCVNDRCYFKFTSDGASEATSLVRILDIPTHKIKAGDYLSINLFTKYEGNAYSDLQVTYLFYDNKGNTLRMSSRVQGIGSITVQKRFPTGINTARVKIIIKNMDKSGVGVTYLDSVLAAVTRTGGTDVPRDTALPLPFPSAQ